MNIFHDSDIAAFGMDLSWAIAFGAYHYRQLLVLQYAIRIVVYTCDQFQLLGFISIIQLVVDYDVMRNILLTLLFG